MDKFVILTIVYTIVLLVLAFIAIERSRKVKFYKKELETNKLVLSLYVKSAVMILRGIHMEAEFTSALNRLPGTIINRLDATYEGFTNRQREIILGFQNRGTVKDTPNGSTIG